MGGEHIGEPGEFGTAAVGRVFIIHYRVQTTLERERSIAAAFVEHCRAHSGRGVILAVNDAPLLPLPPVDVRAHWREFMRDTASIDAVALISSGLAGLAGAAMTNLIEHVMDPAFGVPLRIFTDSGSAIAWLRSITEIDVDDALLLELVRSLRAC